MFAHKDVDLFECVVDAGDVQKRADRPCLAIEAISEHLELFLL